MAEPEHITIGAKVYPNDLAAELDLMFAVGIVCEMDETRQPVEWCVKFPDGRSEWFDAEELDICAS